MKRLLIVSNTIGFFHFLWDDIDYFKGAGFSLFAIADNSKSEDNTLAILQEKGVTFTHAVVKRSSPLSVDNLLFARKVREMVSQYGIDVVYCHTPIVSVWVRIALRHIRKKGLQVVYASHGLTFNHLSSKLRRFVYHSLESVASRFTDAIISINREDFECLKKMHCQKVYLCRGFGVDVQKYSNVDIDSSQYLISLGLPVDKIVIGGIGELSETKNHKVIIEALSMLEDKKDFVYAIRGREVLGASYPEYLASLARLSEVDVRFLGFAKDIPQFVNSVDIGVLPSLREGLGMAGLQFMCAGVPVIGSDIQGIREYVKNGVTGFLCDPYKPEDFAQAIVFLKDESLRKKMKSDCISTAESFSRKKASECRFKIYDEVFIQ